MNFSSLYFFLLLSLPNQLLAAGEGESSCARFTTRSEWRTLDVNFRRRYISAVWDMQRSGSYAYFPQMHYELNFRIHGNAVFLPWHRYFVAVFEMQMQRRDDALHVPYWASSYDSQAPEAAPIWGDDDASFGRSGEGSDWCVRTGVFANWSPSYPSSHCLQRTFGPSTRPFPPVESVNQAIGFISTFDEIAEYLESDVHSYVHAGVGGDMSLMYSPNDPVFFLHHSNIDRLWYNWQSLQPSTRLSEYGGMRSVHYLDLSRTQVVAATADYPLPGYENVRVGDILHPGALCYAYADFQPNAVGGTTMEEAARFGFGRSRPVLGQGTQDSVRNDRTTTLTLIKQTSPAINVTQGRRLLKLRRVEPLSDEWIRMNFLNATFVRANEARLNRLIDSLNLVKGYVSPSALWNRPDMFRTLVQKFNERSFEATLVPNVAKLKATVQDTTDLNKAFFALKDKVSRAAGNLLVAPAPMVKSQVDKVVQAKRPGGIFES